MYHPSLRPTKISVDSPILLVRIPCLRRTIPTPDAKSSPNTESIPGPGGFTPLQFPEGVSRSGKVCGDTASAMQIWDTETHASIYWEGGCTQNSGSEEIEGFLREQARTRQLNPHHTVSRSRDSHLGDSLQDRRSGYGSVGAGPIRSADLQAELPKDFARFSNLPLHNPEIVRKNY